MIWHSLDGVRRLGDEFRAGSLRRVGPGPAPRCTDPGPTATLLLFHSCARRRRGWRLGGRLLVSIRASGGALADGKRARKAATPVHAILNYSYAILEVEATIVAHKHGFDPSLGLMHADQRDCGSLATDLMEPVRPITDSLVLDLLDQHELDRGDVFENREGVCRVGSAMTRRLALFGPAVRSALAPHAEGLTRTLMANADHPTPLTRSRHTTALARSRM
jgi:hypothetical protein